MADEIAFEAGPVLVTIEYRIDPRSAKEFVAAMRSVRTIRLRDGAFFWGLFFDAAEPERFTEYFVVESWAEHVRQHLRGVAADLVAEGLARAYHIGKAPPLVTHSISAQGIDALTNFAPFLNDADAALKAK